MSAHRAAPSATSGRATTKKVLASVAVVGAAATLLSGGIYASWQSSNSHQQQLSAATVSSSFDDTGVNKFTLAVDGLLPGDHVSRYADLTNTGNVTQAFTLSLAGATGSLTEANDGLRVLVQECAEAWVDGVCAPGETAVIGDQFLTDAGQSTQFEMTANQVKYLAFTFTLDANANQATFEGQSDVITVDATGVAVGGGQDRSAG